MSTAFVVIIICIIAWAAYYIYASWKGRRLIEQVTPVTRGERSERRVILELLKEGINPRAIFHDLYIRKPNGEFTQIDLAVATRVGVIVFEVKDYSGWIFGNEHQKYWTQILAYGREKHRFYNPVMQNAGHIQAIRQSLPQNPCIPIYSVIVFFGNSEFKNVTYCSDNTYIIYPGDISRVVSEIMRRPNVNYGNKHEIMNVFTQAVQNGNNPVIVSSQINAAARYACHKPQSIYTETFSTFFRFGRFPFRRWR